MAFKTQEQLTELRKKKNMENDKKYFNRANLVNAQRGIKDESKFLNLMFSTYDPDKKEAVTKWHRMFLTQENNERNQEKLHALGVTDVPGIVSYDTVAKLSGLGTKTVDLVETPSTDGKYRNIAFINEPKFGVRVFDM